MQVLGYGARVKQINIADIENHPAPPAPLPLGRLGNQVQVAPAGSKAGKGGGLAAVAQSKTQRAIEIYGARHVMGGQCEGADLLDARDARLECTRLL